MSPFCGSSWIASEIEVNAESRFPRKIPPKPRFWCASASFGSRFTAFCRICFASGRPRIAKNPPRYASSSASDITARVEFRRGRLSGRFRLEIAERKLFDVTRKLILQFLQIAKRFRSGLVMGSSAGQRASIVEQHLPVRLLIADHQVMSERPRLRIKNRNLVLLVVIGR